MKEIHIDANTEKNTLAIVVITFLLAAILNNAWPYDFFVVLRWIVCGSGLYILWLIKNSKQQKRKVFLIIFSLLFNPFIPIHLTREIWVWIDILTIGFFTSIIIGIKIK